MSNKIHTTTDDRLLHARNEALQSKGSPMRSLGKLWGMDVFSWLNPNLGALINTLQSFPFKIVWMASREEVSKVLGEDANVVENIEAIVMHDAAFFSLKFGRFDQLANCVGTESVVDAFYFVNHLKAPKKILLFTASGDDVIEKAELFEQFIKSR